MLLLGQGKFLVKMITMALSQASDSEKFKALMEDLATKHCQWGVRSIEYGIVGDVLFYALHTVLGEGYTPAVEQSWCRIYSTMLSLILPVVIRYERANVTKQRGVKQMYSNRNAAIYPDCNARDGSDACRMVFTAIKTGSATTTTAAVDDEGVETEYETTQRVVG